MRGTVPKIFMTEWKLGVMNACAFNNGRSPAKITSNATIGQKQWILLYWLIYLLIDWLIDWMNEWMNVYVCMSDWPTSECMYEWLTSEWMNECT